MISSGALGSAIGRTGAIALALSIPQVALAVGIGFRVTDLPDEIPGQDLWRADYTLLNFPYDANDGFAVEFVPDSYEFVRAGEPAPNADWDVLVLQPDPQIPASGLYDALALVDAPDTSGPFAAEFVWLGGPGTAPGAQGFSVNRFAPNGTFLETLEAGETFGFAPDQPGRTETVALQGEPAPSDGNYRDLRFPMVNEASQVTFGATLEGHAGGSAEDYGAFLAEAGSAPVEVLREGRDFPNGFVSDTFNDLGELSAFAPLSDGRNAIYRSSDLGPVLIAQEGQAAPDGDGEFSTFRKACSASNSCTPINNAGELAFGWDLTNTDSGDPESALYVGDENGAQTIVRSGDTEPDGTGVFSRTINPVGYQPLNEAGELVFIGFLVDPVSGVSAGSGIFKGSGGPLTTIAREGQPAPDAGELVGCGNTDLNDAGQVGFTCAVSGVGGGGSGVYRGDGGPVTQIARTGQSAPDGNGEFSSQFNEGFLRINEGGNVLFGARLTGATSATGTGLFTGDGQDVVQIFREGQPTPDGNGVFGGFRNSRAILDGNQVGVQAVLAQTAGGTADFEGFFIGDGEEIITAVRRGQVIGGKTIRDLEFSEVAPMNQLDQVTFRAVFDDLSDGIFLFTPDLHWRRSASGSWDTRDNWTLGFDPAAVHDVFLDPDVNLAVSGPQESAVVRNLFIGSGAGTPTLDIALAGTERGIGFGGFEIEDTLAVIRGALRISVVDGFVPELGDAFDLAVAERILGEFDVTSLPALAPGLLWTLETLVDAEGTRDVLRLAVGVPEPGLASMLGSALLLAAAVRKARRRPTEDTR